MTMPAPKGNEYAKGNRGGGRKSNYRAEYAEQAKKLCQMGFTDQMLGAFFGVNESTINRWKLEHEEFLQALRVGKAVADDAVERAVFQAIVGHTRTEQKLIGSGEEARIIEVEKYYPPQAGAGLKWLAARRPEQYRDKREPEDDNGDPHTLITPDVLRAGMMVMREEAIQKRRDQAKHEKAEGAESKRP